MDTCKYAVSIQKHGLLLRSKYSMHTSWTIEKLAATLLQLLDSRCSPLAPLAIARAFISICQLALLLTGVVTIVRWRVRLAPFEPRQATPGCEC